MKLEQAARQVVDAWDLGEFSTRMDEAITALRKALSEQAEQEPVAWIDNKTWCFTYSQYEYEDLDDDMTDDLVPLYAAPVRTKDLTDSEIRAMFNGYVAPEILLMFRAIIAADRRKNK